MCHQKNVVACPQNPDAALRALGMSPMNLASMVQVQFVGENRDLLRKHPDLHVSVQKLRAAFRWLSTHSWPFMEATKYHELWEEGGLDQRLEKLLDDYKCSVTDALGCVSKDLLMGVPKELIQGASQISADRVRVHASGPANCTEPAGEGDEDTNDADDAHNSVDNCVGVIDGGVDSVTPLQIWDAVMKKYKVLQQCAEELARLRKSDDESKKAAARRNEAMALADVAKDLSKLHGRDARARLVEFVKSQGGSDNPMVIPHTGEFLNNRDPLFWYSCFVRLFPRGDCAERCEERPDGSSLPSWLWAKTLLTRADCVLWRQDVEFIASVYNIHLRRDQIRAVEASVRAHSFSRQQCMDLEQLSASELVNAALQSGDAKSVREALKTKTFTHLCGDGFTEHADNSAKSSRVGSGKR